MEFGSSDLYEPLIWYLIDIKKCDIHETLLQDQCPNCNRKLSYLHSRYTVGYCQYCGFRLGDQKEVSKEPLSTEEEFTIMNYKQLIANAPNLLFFPTKSFIPIFIKRIIEDLGFKSITRFSKFLG